jgi:hypothetical protein
LRNSESFEAINFRFEENNIMAKKTGWDALPKKYRETNLQTGEEPFIPKQVLVKYGLWDEWVEGIMLSGSTDEQIIKDFEEYDCSAEEIAGYFDQYDVEPVSRTADDELTFEYAWYSHQLRPALAKAATA